MLVPLALPLRLVALLVLAVLITPGLPRAEAPGLWDRFLIDRYIGVEDCAGLIRRLEDKRRAGERIAITELGLLYDSGGCVAQDHAKAAGLYREAWDAGDTRAGYRLARLYLEGLGVPQNEARGTELFRAAALEGLFCAGDSRRKYSEWLGDFTFAETTVPADALDDALSWLEEIDRLPPDEQLALAKRYRADPSRPHYRQLALCLVLRSHNSGLPEASYHLGRWLLEDADDARDVRRATVFLDTAATACHPDALIEMAYRHMRDQGVFAASACQALRHLENAADLGLDVREAMAELRHRHGTTLGKCRPSPGCA